MQLQVNNTLMKSVYPVKINTVCEHIFLTAVQRIMINTDPDKVRINTDCEFILLRPTAVQILKSNR